MKHYRQWFNQLITDKKRTQEKTQQLKDSKVDQWLTEDTQQFIAVIQQKVGKPAQQEAIETSPLGERLKIIFKTVYIDIHLLSFRALRLRSGC